MDSHFSTWKNSFSLSFSQRGRIKKRTWAALPVIFKRT